MAPFSRFAAYKNVTIRHLRNQGYPSYQLTYEAFHLPQTQQVPKSQKKIARFADTMNSGITWYCHGHILPPSDDPQWPLKPLNEYTYSLVQSMLPKYLPTTWEEAATSMNATIQQAQTPEEACDKIGDRMVFIILLDELKSPTAKILVANFIRQQMTPLEIGKGAFFQAVDLPPNVFNFNEVPQWSGHFQGVTVESGDGDDIKCAMCYWKKQ